MAHFIQGQDAALVMSLCGDYIENPFIEGSAAYAEWEEGFDSVK